ncbi:MAG TPA: ankyrin repeat domain-containing protein [Tepidisphaeraceae bacterium]|jgi:ankyrin repeat protein|nr:ankyrin repeat domain-containing protein [Tepidisphaeraceae bacterium]
MAWRKCAGIALILLLSSGALAHETDQFILPPYRQFADLSDVFTHWAYDLLERAVEKTNSEIHQPLAEGNEKRLEQLYSQDHMVLAVNGQFPWAGEVIEGLDHMLQSDQARARYPGLVVSHKSLGNNIYSGVGLPFDPRQLIRLFYSSDFKAYGIHMGTDKIGHFTDMGLNYYRAWREAKREGKSEEESRRNAVHLGTGDFVFSEKGLLGMVTAGSYSNADLVANYVGMLFYRNLTEPMRIRGEMRPPMLVREGQYWRLNDHVQRDSDFFSVFFDEHLDESLNPSVYDGTLRGGVRMNVQAYAGNILQRHCDIHGNRRGKEYFDNWMDGLSTYYGEDYGHAGDLEHVVAISNTCFGPLNEEQDVAARGPTGHTAMHRAAAAGDVAAIRRLLGRGADVNIRVRSNEHYSSEWGNTPLHLAARDGREEAVAALIDAGADVNAVNDRGVTVLHRALTYPNIAATLISKGAKVDAADIRRQTALHYCARDLSAKIVDRLLEKGANADALDHQGRSPVHLAAAAGNLEMLKKLLSHKAKIDAPDEFGITPLHLAAGQENTAVVQILLGSKASISARDEFARTPLHDAANSGSLESVALLLKAGADPSARDAYGTTPLHLACRRSRTGVTKVLLEKGVDVNVQNAAGATPLHEAAMVGDWPLVRLLLSRGADARIMNRKKQTALDVATDHRRLEVMGVLQNEIPPAKTP